MYIYIYIHKRLRQFDRSPWAAAPGRVGAARRGWRLRESARRAQRRRRTDNQYVYIYIYAYVYIYIYLSLSLSLCLSISLSLYIYIYIERDIDMPVGGACGTEPARR